MGTKSKARSPARPKKKKLAKEKTQRERFIETARAIGVDETGREFEQLFSKAAPAKKN